MNAADVPIVWARSPVAIGSAVAAPHAREGGGVLRRHRLLDPARARTARARPRRRPRSSGEKRPCISIMRSMSGPIASRTAATIAMARRRSGARQLGARRDRTGRASSPDSRARRTVCASVGDPRRLALGLIPAVRVGGHAIAELAAEQLPDRHAERAGR